MTTPEHPTQEELMDYLHGELPNGSDAQVHAHLADCSTCAEALDGEARVSELLREYARLQERELPPGLVEGIYHSIRAQANRPSWQERVSNLLRPAIALPAAAAIALAAYLGFVSSHGTARANTIAAAYYLEDHAEIATSVPFDDGSIAPAMLTSNDGSVDERAANDSH